MVLNRMEKFANLWIVEQRILERRFFDNFSSIFLDLDFSQLKRLTLEGFL